MLIRLFYDFFDGEIPLSCSYFRRNVRFCIARRIIQCSVEIPLLQMGRNADPTG